MKFAISVLIGFYIGLGLVFVGPVFPGEIDDLKKELTVIQMKISEEEARYQAAKAQMERSQLVAQYLFPELRQREKQLAEKIEKLAEQKKPEAEKKTASK